MYNISGNSVSVNNITVNKIINAIKNKLNIKLDKQAHNILRWSFFLKSFNVTPLLFKIFISSEYFVISIVLNSKPWLNIS